MRLIQLFPAKMRVEFHVTAQIFKLSEKFAAFGGAEVNFAIQSARDKLLLFEYSGD